MKRSLAVYNKNGVLYTGNHEIGDAVLAFNTTIDLNPDFAEAHANLASLYYNELRMKEESLPSYAGIPETGAGWRPGRTV